jgi:hypothetical protein
MARHLLFVSVLFGFIALVPGALRPLAYTVRTKCSGVTKTTRVRISINQNGTLRVR